MHNNSPVSKNLFYFWKICGLCPFDLHKTEIIKRSKSGTLYTMFLVIAFIICNFQVFITRIISNRLPLETTVIFCIDFFGLLLEFAVNTTIWLYAIIYQNQLRLILRSLENVIETAISLGMCEVYKTISRQLHLIVIISNIAFTIVIFFDLMYDHSELVDHDFSIWLPFDIARCVSVNAIIIYSYTLKVVKSLFTFINDSLKILPEAKIAQNVRRTIKIIRLSSHEVDIRLNELGQLHLDLKNLTTMLSELFSLPLLIALIMLLSQSIHNIYMISVFINKGWHRSLRGVRGLVPLITFLSLRLTQMLTIVNVCDTTCQEANRKAIILHELWASRRPENSIDRVNNVATLQSDGAKLIKSELLQLKKNSIQLLQQPMVIKLYDSLHLNHQLIHKMTGVTITYLTIMMQIDKQNHLVDGID